MLCKSFKTVFFCLFSQGVIHHFPAACCRRLASGCGGSDCGYQSTSPGPTWRTAKVVSTPKPPTFMLCCRAPSACSWSDTYLRGENTQCESKTCLCVSNSLIWVWNAEITLRKMLEAMLNMGKKPPCQFVSQYKKVIVPLFCVLLQLPGQTTG